MGEAAAGISGRKADHIAIAASGRADFERSTLLDEVYLVHEALPERGLEEVELRATIAGQHLAAPLMVTGMTGGTEEAARINRDVARAAEAVGVAFGVGSQRAMAEHPELAASFQVRKVAPNVVLIGNIGVVQARTLGVKHVAELARTIEANAMAVHLNPAQELIQSEGDRDFRGGLDIIARLQDELRLPLIVKETGCGISRSVAQRLKSVGVTTIDVAGAGGTSWVAVEARRAASASASEQLGTELWNWGIPTAVSTALCAAEGLTVIASGGLRSGLDVARALALGATAGGMAAPVLRAQREHGEAGVLSFLTRTIASIKATTLLSGAASSAELHTRPRHLGRELASWIDELGIRQSHPPR